jgi:hypothetical protein
MSGWMTDLILAGSFLAAGIVVGALGAWSVLAKRVDGQALQLSRDAFEHGQTRVDLSGELDTEEIPLDHQSARQMTVGPVRRIPPNH